MFLFPESLLQMVSGQLPPPRKIVRWLGLGHGSRSGLVLGLWPTRQYPPRKIARRLGLGFGLGLVLEFGGNYPRTTANE